MKKLVLIDEIQPGMIPADPIKNKFGQMLLSDGTVIEQRHILLLKTWGVHSIFIQEDSSTPEHNDDALLLKKASEQIKNRMKWRLRIPIEEDMFRMALKIQLQKQSY